MGLSLAEIEVEFSRLGLLLQHDRELPSFTTLASGSPIKGSWWGHPLGHELYDRLSEFGRGAGALSVKLVNGKVTYVHSRLWRALLKLVQHAEAARAAKLSSVASSLRAFVLREGSARVDELVKSGFASSSELTLAARALEQALLVHADSIHTTSGAHTKILQSWARWGTLHDLRVDDYSLSAARAELAESVKLLGDGSARRIKVAVLDAATDA